MNRIFLYGIAAVEDNYRVVWYQYIDPERELITIKAITGTATWMKYKNPNIEHVYAIDESLELGYFYKTTVRRNTFESNVQFKLILEKMGWMIV